MSNRVRINLANPAELLELPGIGPEQVRPILKFRAEHGPSRMRASSRKSWAGGPGAEALWSAWSSIRGNHLGPKRQAP